MKARIFFYIKIIFLFMIYSNLSLSQTSYITPGVGTFENVAGSFNDTNPNDGDWGWSPPNSDYFYDGDLSTDGDEAAIFWTSNSTDADLKNISLYNLCGNAQDALSPTSYFGYQHPHRGSKYAGVYGFHEYCNNHTNVVSGEIALALHRAESSIPLLANTDYVFECWVSKMSGSNSYSSENEWNRNPIINVYLSDAHDGNDLMDLISYYEIKEDGGSSGTNWKHLVVNFNSGSNGTNFEWIVIKLNTFAGFILPTDNLKSGFFIDDVGIYDKCAYYTYNGSCSESYGDLNILTTTVHSQHAPWYVQFGRNVTFIDLNITDILGQTINHITYDNSTNLNYRYCVNGGIDIVYWNGKSSVGTEVNSGYYYATVILKDECNDNSDTPIHLTIYKANDPYYYIDNVAHYTPTDAIQPLSSDCDWVCNTYISRYYECCATDLFISNINIPCSVAYYAYGSVTFGPNNTLGDGVVVYAEGNDGAQLIEPNNYPSNGNYILSVSPMPNLCRLSNETHYDTIRCPLHVIDLLYYSTDSLKYSFFWTSPEGNKMKSSHFNYIPKSSGNKTISLYIKDNYTGHQKVIDYYYYIEACLNENNSQGQTGIFNVQPNPSNGSFLVKMDMNDYNMKDIQIGDVYGKIIYQQFQIQEPYIELNLSKQAKGIYFIKVIENGFVKIKKLIIQ